ncbi:MAG: glutathione S-transferase family protein [Pikeienuella sp.]
MYILHAYSPAFSEPSASPFVLKAMCLLQMSGAAWCPKFSTDPRKAPKAKFPVLQDGEAMIPDSSQIAAWLEDKLQFDFNAGLDDDARAVGHAFQRMAEEHLYFALVQDRWARDDCWAIIREKYFGFLPWPLRVFVPGLVRKSALKDLNGQGMGRHSFKEATARAALDIRAIRVQLVDKAFLMGAGPTLTDASVAPMLGAIADGPIDTPLRRLVRDAPDLMGYLERVRGAIYPQVGEHGVSA